MKQVLWILIILPNLLFAQFTDDFSDANFLSNPAWGGDTTNWMVLNGQLRSNGPATTPTVSYLSTSSVVAYNCQWEFFVNPKLATSSGNFMDVFLIADQKNLNSNLNGYFVRIGGTKDEISLYKKNGAIITKIIDGSDKMIASSSNNPFKIKIIRTLGFEWSLETDKTGSGTNYDLQGKIIDDSFNSSNYFGVLIHYSSANSKKYFFDDFYIGPIIIDSIAPAVSGVKLVSSNELDIYFNEAVNQALAENPDNYFETGGIGNPIEASRDNSNANLVHLSFANPFSSKVSDTIIIKNIKDLANNTIAPSSCSFLYYRALKHDVVFNEIMPDPSPVNSLPEQEYIELYNNTSFPISISNWILECGLSSKIIPEAVILPDSFLVICSEDAYPDLEHLGNCIALPGLSGSALINGGTSLNLKDKTGIIIHSIAYTTEWYNDDSKKEGGWAIEQIDPLNPCGAESNWLASINYLGGTPGRKNSVFAENPDNKAPEISAICVIDSLNLEVLFSENVLDVYASDPLTFEINPEIGKPIEAIVNGNTINTVKLILPKPLSSSTTYDLTLSNKISDCAGNKISPNSKLSFSMQEAKEYDVVFNEIMVNPSNTYNLPKVEYIELLNRNSFPINLNGWKLFIGNYAYEFQCQNIAANGLLILCNKINQPELNTYGKTYGIVGLGILPNESGHLILKNNKNEIISSITYSDSWYKNLNKIKGGWAIEQIDPDNVCAGASNWTACIDENGGTPGKINSVNGINSDVKKPELLKAIIIDSLNVRLYFSEKLNKSDLTNPDNYFVDKQIGVPLLVTPCVDDFFSIIITLPKPIYPDNVYKLFVKNNLMDCAGNFLEKNCSIPFAFPEKTAPGDIIINEVLFNPKLNGEDFVEIYNRSSKIIDLKELQISTIDNYTQSLSSSISIDTSGYLLFPNSYVVLSGNSENIKNWYFAENPNAFIDIPAMPSFNNEQGDVIINKINGEIIDQFNYSQKMQFPLLNTYEGISLERINSERPTNDFSNWHSASEKSGFATPTYENSQHVNSSESINEIYLEPELFSPDNDGNKDVINVNYNFIKSGYLANATIYDTKGRAIRFLLRNELLGSTGTFTWDGINEFNEKSPIGNYILFIEVFDLEGFTAKYKYNCYLVGKI